MEKSLHFSGLHRVLRNFLALSLMLLTFVALPIDGWGQTTTYSLTPDQSSTGSTATTYITSLTEFTYSNVSWKMNQWNPKNLQVKTNQSNAANEFRFYNTSAFPGRITQVVIKFSALTLSSTTTTGFMFVGGTSTVTATTGGTNGTWNSTEKTITWTPGASDNFTYFAFYQNGKVATGTNNLATSDAIIVTYETSTYTVSFDAGAGTFVGSTDFPNTSNTVAAGTYTLPSATPATGYTFDGWTATGITEPITSSYTVSGDIDFTAQYTENSGNTNSNVKWIKTNVNDLTSSDIFVIVGNNSSSNYAMSNDKGTSNPPSAIPVTVINDTITSSVAANIQWTISGNSNSGYTFYPVTSTASWLSCTTTASSSSNNNIRVGTGGRKFFIIKNIGGKSYLTTKDNNTDRFICIYNNSDWRGYVQSNIVATNTSFYKKVTSSVIPPSISADNVNIAYDATNGSISYTINNPVEGGVLTAASNDNWLTIGTIGQTVPFTCTANNLNTARTATVTLTYTYNTSETVTKEVTVTQAAAPYTITFVPGNSGTCNTPSYTGSSIDLSNMTATPLNEGYSNGWRFYGWSETELTESSIIAPSIVSNPYVPSSNGNLYAVYRRIEGEPSNAYYKLVNETTNDWSGDYLIVYDNKAFNGGLENLDASGNYINVSNYAENGIIISNSTTDAAKFTIENSNNKYSIRASNGKFIGWTNSGNGLTASNYAIATEITYDQNNNNIIINSTGNETAKLLFYNSGNQSRFRFYTTNQQPIQLFKYIPATDGTNIYASSPDCSLPISYFITVTQVEGATISATPTSAPSGNTINLSINTEEGKALNEWHVSTSDGTSIMVNNNSFEMPAHNVIVTATLVNVYTIAASANPTNGGNITGAGQYNEGTNVTLTANANSGNDFIGWYNGGENPISTDNPYIFTVTENLNLEARFRARYTVSFNAGTSGTCNISSLEGSSINLNNVTAVPSEKCVNEGWEFAGWSESAVAETTIAPTLVSSPYVPSDNTELFAVYRRTEIGAGADTWTKATSVAAGDVVVIVNETASKELTGISNNIGTATNYTTIPNGTYPLTIEQGYSDNSYAFKDANNNYLYYSGSSNDISQSNELNNKSSWIINFSDGNVEIKNVDNTTRQLQYNSTQPRFVCYAGTQKAVQLYKLAPSDVTTYNSNPNCITYYHVYTSNNTSANGTFTIDPTEAAENATITLTPSVNEHYHLTGWSFENANGDPVSISATGNAFTMPAYDVYVAMQTALDEYIITASVSPANAGTITGLAENGKYVYNTTATLTATANTGFTFFNWTKDGAVVSTNATYTFTVTEAGNYVANFAYLADSISIDVNYHPDSTDVNSDYVKVQWDFYLPVEDFETGDFSKFNWQLDANYPWEITTTNPYEGIYCMKSGNVGIHSSSSSMSITINYPNQGTISFVSKISCESNWDYGYFYIDGEEKLKASGTSDWRKKQFTIEAGVHTFTWIYQKDGVVNSNDDCYYVDSLCFNLIPKTTCLDSHWHTYCESDLNNAVGSNIGIENWAYEYPISKTSLYAGLTLTKVSLFSDNLYSAVGGNYTCTIYIGGDNPTAGTAVSTITVDMPSNLNAWVDFDLETPVTVSGTEPLWVVWTANTKSSSWPAGCCDGLVDQGTWWDGGEGWEHLTYGTWTMRQYFEIGNNIVQCSTPDKVCGNDIHYRVYRTLCSSSNYTLIADNLTKQELVDSTWSTLTGGSYKYGIGIVEDASRPIQWSNCIVNNNISIDCPDVQDVDGHLYHSVQIGSNCWMTENLRTTHYADGRSITNIYRYQCEGYPNAEANANTFGLLYDWYDALDSNITRTRAIHKQGICPAGWHIPTDDEFYELINTDLQTVRSTDYWLYNAGNNASGFDMKPAGLYNYNTGRYENLLGNSYLWSATTISTSKARCYAADCNCYLIYELTVDKTSAFSVRCVKNY